MSRIVQVRSYKTSRRVAHPERVSDAAQHVDSTAHLFSRGKIPDSIAVFMLATPTKRLLRAIYGSDLRAALVLLKQALQEQMRLIPARVHWWWRYDVRGCDPEKDRDRCLDSLEADAGDSDDD